MFGKIQAALLTEHCSSLCQETICSSITPGSGITYTVQSTGALEANSAVGCVCTWWWWGAWRGVTYHFSSDLVQMTESSASPLGVTTWWTNSAGKAATNKTLYGKVHCQDSIPLDCMRTPRTLSATDWDTTNVSILNNNSTTTLFPKPNYTCSVTQSFAKHYSQARKVN